MSEVASKLGLSAMTVTRWCESGKLPALAKPYGKKVSYQISPQAIDFLIQSQQKRLERKEAAKTSHKEHQDYLTQWKAALSKGTMTGRAFSSRTVKLYEDYGKEFFARHKALSPETLEASLNRIPANSISKRQNFYKALISLGKYLIRQAALEPEFLEKVKTLCPKRHLPPKRHTISPEQLETLLQSCKGGQDRLIIQLLASTGIRNAEACALRISDIDLELGILLVRCGKGGKQRKVGLSSTAMNVLKEHLKKNQRPAEAFLLLSAKGKPLTIDGLYQRVERMGRQAGMQVSPHALRRAFVTHNANKGRSLVMLQMACGHSEITTTRSYCLTAEQEVIEAMKGWD